MGILEKLKGGGQVLDAATTLLDQAVMPPQEKADKTIEYQERTGSTPSSESRRWVTKFMIIFVASFAVLSVILYQFDPEWGKFAGIQLAEFCSNWVITTIVVFFYGGYYVTKNLSNRQKLKNTKREKEIDIDIQKAELRVERKRDRIDRKKRRHTN